MTALVWRSGEADVIAHQSHCVVCEGCFGFGWKIMKRRMDVH